MTLAADMNTNMNHPICDICRRRPATTAIQVGADATGHQNLFCETCLRQHMGAISQRLGGPMLAALLGPMVGMASQQRRISHPTFDQAAQELISHAMSIAAQAGHPVVDASHLIRAFLHRDSGVQALQAAGVDNASRQKLVALLERLGLGQADPANLTHVHPLSPGLKATMRAAQHIAASQGSATTGPDHLWRGLVDTADGTALELLREALGDGVRGGARQSAPTTPTLDQFGRDLTEEARQGKIDPVIGRGHEIEQTVEILARRRKNNAVLIGEPGVGKTAIVEGLALQIVNGEVPETLKDCRVVEVDLGGMIAGSQFRGQFEERLKRVLAEVQQSNGEIVLFIDELHTLVGAGSAEGSMDAANMLKPMLARGELQMIGATTLGEYKKVERDGALARRFSPVYIDEPSVEDTVEIMRGVKEAYEAHHGVLIADEALVAAAKLADRYLHEQRMPDKAIDLLDQAGARMRLAAIERPDEVRALEAQVETHEREKDRAVSAEEFERAAGIKTRLDELRGRLAGMKLPAAERDGPVTLSARDVTEVVARRTGIPAGELAASEAQRLRALEDDLHERVVGQNEAVELVADAVRRSRVGLHGDSGTIGSFLFLGPTGVGKTELAKALSERLFGTQDAMLRLDMSEFREPHTVARLIGSPPGYVGFGEGGQLTEPVRRRPYQVVLLDEIEKAHADVWTILLQLLDDGRLTDGEGRTVDFRQTVVIMTSNLGAGRAKQPLGFASDVESSHDDERLKAAAKAAFPPELWNRIDEVVAFHPLESDHIASITERMISNLAAQLQTERDVNVAVSPTLIAQLAEQGFDAELGARPLRRHLRRTVERQLTQLLLAGELASGQHIRFDVEDHGEIVWEIFSEPEVPVT